MREIIWPERLARVEQELQDPNLASNSDRCADLEVLLAELTGWASLEILTHTAVLIDPEKKRKRDEYLRDLDANYKKVIPE